MVGKVSKYRLGRHEGQSYHQVYEQGGPTKESGGNRAFGASAADMLPRHPSAMCHTAGKLRLKARHVPPDDTHIWSHGRNLEPIELRICIA